MPSVPLDTARGSRSLLALILVACAITRCTSAHPTAAPPVPAIVIPGFGVSRLFDPNNGRYVWGTPRSMVETNYADDLDLPWDAREQRFSRDTLVARGFVGSRGPINTAWHLAEGLRRFGGYRTSYQRRVRFDQASAYPFAWDWRLSLDESTASLDAFIEQIRRAHRDPRLRVDLVTHSAGGVLALLYLRIGTARLDRPEDWAASAERARAKIRRVVLVAPPQTGVTDPLRINVQSERFARRTFTPEMVATWPSVVELLPEEPRFIVGENGSTIDADLLTIEGWRSLSIGLFDPGAEARVVASLGPDAYRRLVEEFAKSLSLATLLRRAMRLPLPADIPVTIVAGDCIPTPRRALRRSDGTYAFYPRQLRAEERRLASLLFEPGDGTIPISSATRDGADASERFCIGHQSLAGAAASQKAVVAALAGP